MSNSVVLCTLILNEIEWIEKLYQQHKNWPGLKKWVFVESADITYAATNPTMVTNDGLSVDGTTSFLRKLVQEDSRIAHIEYGYSGVGLSKDQAKCEARTQYLRIADDYKPDLICVLDADEMYTWQDQQTISNILHHSSNRAHTRLAYKGSAFCFPQRHIWYPPYLQEHEIDRLNCRELKLFSHEVIGGYWEVIHTRVWRWESGLKYERNHNWPEDKRGVFLIHKGEAQMRNDTRAHYSLRDMVSSGIPVPQCIHMGYASNVHSRRAKHQYYIDRGEGNEPDIILRHRRIKYVNCRHAWESWEPGSQLPYGARVVTYSGPIPEIFREDINNEKR